MRTQNFYSTIDPSIRKKIEEIDNEIQLEIEKGEEADNKKILELRNKQLMQGLMINIGNIKINKPY